MIHNVTILMSQRDDKIDIERKEQEKRKDNMSDCPGSTDCHIIVPQDATYTNFGVETDAKGKPKTTNECNSVEPCVGHDVKNALSSQLKFISKRRMNGVISIHRYKKHGYVYCDVTRVC